MRVKPEATAAVENAYNTRKQEIQNSNASTTEEKEAAYTQLDEKQEALTNIDTENTNNGVATAKDNGISAINQIQAATTKRLKLKRKLLKS